MKTCPVAGCEVAIHDADVVCPGCLRVVPRPFRDRFSSTWRAFQRSFSDQNLAEYEAATRAVIVAAGQAKRPKQLPFDGL
jgi:hypothetical protein